MSDFTIGAFRSAQRFSLRQAIGSVFSVFHEMMRARATRQMLPEMDDRLLADIGIGRGDALHESRRPMWDLGRSRR